MPRLNSSHKKSPATKAQKRRTPRKCLIGVLGDRMRKPAGPVSTTSTTSSKSQPPSTQTRRRMPLHTPHTIHCAQGSAHVASESCTSSDVLRPEVLPEREARRKLQTPVGAVRLSTAHGAMQIALCTVHEAPLTMVLSRPLRSLHFTSSFCKSVSIADFSKLLLASSMD